MSALPVEPEHDVSTPYHEDETPPSSDELVRDLHRMVSEIHGLIVELKPAVEQVMADIKSGGLMGLMGAMMSGRR